MLRTNNEAFVYPGAGSYSQYPQLIHSAQVFPKPGKILLEQYTVFNP